MQKQLTTKGKRTDSTRRQGKLLCLLFLWLSVWCFTACTQHPDKKTMEEMQEQLIALDDTLFFLPHEYTTEFFVQVFDSIEQQLIRQGDHTNRAMLHHILSNLYIQEGKYSLAFNEAHKLLNIAEEEYDNAIYFLTLSNIDTELNLFNKAHDRLHSAVKGLKENRTLLTRLYLHELELSVIHKDFDQALLQIDKIERLNVQNGKEALPLNMQIRYHTWVALFHLYTGNTEECRRMMEAYDAHTVFPNSYGYKLIGHLLHRNYHTVTGDYPQALRHALAYIEECRKMKNRQWLLNGYERAGRILETIGEKEEAVRYFQVVLEAKDSLSTNSMEHQQLILEQELQADELDFRLWKKRHALLQSALAGGIIALCIIIGIVAYLVRLNRRLKASTLKLAAARKDMDKSIQAKSLFLSNMSHEIRTPLNAVAGFSEILISQPDMDKELRSECNGIIRENSLLLLKLLDDVLDLSNLDIEKMNFSLKDTDAVAVCRSLAGMMQSIRHTSNATISFRTELQELVLHTDENRLRQLLINLLTNATKFTREGSITLALSLDESGKNALFSVTDTGCGIPPEKQKSVFSRFEKLHEGVSGSGLGLSICHGIIHRLGGDIWVDSSYTQGARFVFSHPIKRQEKGIGNQHNSVSPNR